MASSASLPQQPSNRIERAHQMYRDGSYREALGFYTEALSMAKTKQQKIALHSNRAACYLKLHDFKKAAYECTSVLELDYNHTGALMLRAQTLVTLKEYNSALFDVNRLIELNPSSEVYQNLQARLKTQVSLAPIPESEAELEEEEELDEEELCTVEKEDEKEREKENVKEFVVVSVVEKDHRAEPEVSVPKTPGINKSSELEKDLKAEPKRTDTAPSAPQHNKKTSSVQDSKGWQAIPKPKGHSTLDYARWDSVEDDSSEDDEDDDDDDEDSQPQYRFRVRTVGVRSVK
ncbi:hypothetical protein ACOSP7_027717 [Xanthoceras sorbifolium]|uniref:Uncharacterized protein n=1 Tax=Xanthoceras sorbifolium TaxID=99658 RepID=A0ABQ8HGT7_9ROSI|nr:hypothetical protein JRO89_XS11G0225700 [Xanthoceras sorbifolium]